MRYPPARGAAPPCTKRDRKLKRAVAGAAVAVCLGLLAGCGSSDSDSDSDTSTSATTAVAPGVATATRELAPYLELPQSIGITDRLTRQPTGKTVVYLECSIVNCKDHAVALREAFSHLGVNFKTIPSGLSAETFTNAFATAKQLHPDGVITDGIPAAISQRPTDAFAAAGTPVVAMASPDLRLGRGVYNVESPDFYAAMGRTMANWAIADSDGSAKVLYLQDPTLAFGESETQGLQDAFAANCPDCTLDVLRTSSAEIGAALPPKVVSELQRKPDTTYVIGQYSALLIGVPTALKTASISGLKLVGFAPTPINQAAMKAGDEAAGVMQSNAAFPWYAADAMARALVGQPVDEQAVANPAIVQLVRTDGVDWDPRADWPYIPGWQQQFTDLWGGS